MGCGQKGVGAMERPWPQQNTSSTWKHMTRNIGATLIIWFCTNLCTCCFWQQGHIYVDCDSSRKVLQQNHHIKYLIPELQRVTHMDTQISTLPSVTGMVGSYSEKKKLTTSKLNNTHIRTLISWVLSETSSR